MRDSSSWRKSGNLDRAIAAEWASTGELGFDDLADVELGLFLLEMVAPDQRPQAVWTLLGGYPLAEAVAGPLDPDQDQAIRVARELLPSRRAPKDWEHLIREYARIPEQLRGYLIAPDGSGFSRRSPRVAAFRFDVYRDVLRDLPAYRTTSIKTATPGRYAIATDRGQTGVRIPGWLPSAREVPAHDVTSAPARSVYRVSWEELRKTAKWADGEEERLGLSSNWAGRLESVTLALRQPDGTLYEDRNAVLEIDRVFHLIGMVGAGKSTLMDLLCMHAQRSRPRRQVTVVVGDVTTLLRKVVYFNLIGLTAAPIVGHSNRERHVERLHRLSASRSDPRLSHLAEGQTKALFNLVGTSCGIDGLRDHDSRPLRLLDAPCTKLLDPDRPDRRFGCPLWARCARHKPARDLVGAGIWVATVPGLVYAQVPEHVNSERLRYVEAAWRRSDLIIIDEADQAQAQVDTIFSPSQILRGRNAEAWLDEVIAHTSDYLRQHRWDALGDKFVRDWTSAANNAKSAVDLIYMLLRIDLARSRHGGGYLFGWLDMDYFTDWTVSQQLAQAWSGFTGGRRGAPLPGWQTDADYQRLREIFDEFIDRPLDGPDNETARSLSAVAKTTLHQVEESARLANISDWIADLAAEWAGERALVIDELERQAARLEFAVVLAILSDQLHLMITLWKAVEQKIGLEAANPLVFHRPPRDLLTVVPSAPMGQVLGFQYQHDEDDESERAPMGELSFFRCEGVGRWMIAHLDTLFADLSSPPANVLLMSGTSWAGTSPRYHIDVPVKGVLQPNADDVDAISRSRFEFLPLYREYDNKTAITVSGRFGEQREEALDAMVRALIRKRADGSSLIERHRDKLASGRRRVLLLTGSYIEARQVARTITRLRPGWDDHVRYLIRDDDEFDDQWDGPLPMHRGEITELADTGAWILVAPLLAVERGHNILNEDGVAALGAAYFLIRPHPRPDDLSYVSQRLNQWACDQIRGHLPAVPPIALSDIGEAGTALRLAGYHRWRNLLRQKLAYSTLGNAEREALVWTQLVTIWQVVGRLVRGGQDAHVYFCDAAFAPNTANRLDGDTDTAASSLVVGLRSVLDLYFDPSSSDPERHLVQALYGPLYEALLKIRGM